MFNIFRGLKRGAKRGQAIVEYALLLMVVALSATAFLALDEGMKTKIRQIAEGYETDVEIIPDFTPELQGCVTNEECLELSPPVAKFQIPSPIYKGRDVKIVDESFDVDGYIEHYIWSINGSIIRMTGDEVRTNGGLEQNFRKSGNYTVSLMVIDNDGLISNLEIQQLTVLNRAPILDLKVENEQGERGTTVNVMQWCSATFYTEYTDPDLPFDELEAFSRFTDQNGVVSTDNSAPNEFVRDFPNLGTNTYYVRITDEDGESTSKTVTVNVIPNPTGACKEEAEIERPNYKIQVTGHYKQEGNVYYFIPGTRATVRPIVEWGSHEGHAIPYYWNATEPNFAGLWYTPQLGGQLQFPSNGMFMLDTKDIRVTGMARDTSALSNSPNPNLRGMSNQDVVILRVVTDSPTLEKFTPRPIISLENKKHRSDKETVRTVDTTYSNPEKKYTTPIESVLSYGSSENSKIGIKGVRWRMPDGSWRPRANENGAVQITDVTGNTKWYYQGKINSPDSINNKTFTWTQNGSNTWTYELEVINDYHITSKSNAKKTIKVLYTPNILPVAVCSPSPQYAITGKSVTLTATGTYDPDGKAPQVRWRKGTSGSWSSWRSTTANSPEYSWNSKGDKTVQLQVEDERGGIVTKNCTVNVANPPAASTVKFKPEINYMESRVDHSYKPLQVRNRTTGETLQYYSGFTGSITRGRDSHSFTYKSYFGRDGTSGWQNNKHTQRHYIDTKNKVGVFSTYVHVTDSSARSNSTQCTGGQLITKTISGQRLTNACSKGTHFFRMGAFRSNWAYIGGEQKHFSSASYCSISKDYKTFADYERVYDRASGLYDSYKGWSIDANIKRMLRECKTYKPSWL